VKVRDPGSGLESGWSETWHFNIESPHPTLDDVRLDPAPPSAADTVRIYACSNGEWEVFVNTATDGSINGEWKLVTPPFRRDCDPNKPENWVNWWTLPWEDGRHRVRFRAFKNGENIVRDDWIYELLHRRPNGVKLINPSHDIWLNDRTVTFRWSSSSRAQNYRLVVATDENLQNQILNQTLDASTTSFTTTFSEDYPSLYWEVYASNNRGTEGSGRSHFGIDRVAPSSSVSLLPPTTVETKFAVQWGGSDDRSGIRWYDIQYRDGERGEWTDWQVGVTQIAAIFSGQPGHTYCFRARAMDNAGNWEPYPGGDGDTCTRVDPGAAPPTAWWNTAYAFKRNLLVLNNDSHSLPVGYPVRLHFDNSTTPTASDLYNASQSSNKGDDFRIVYNNQTELPRFVQTFSSERIDIWFNLQAGIGPSPGSDGTSYQLYYANSNATNPPGDVNDVLPPGADGNTVGLWHCQEASGNSLIDSSGRGHTGIINNGTRDPDGKFGGAVVFDGSSTTLNMGDHPDFDLRSFTLEGWFYFSPPGTQVLMRRDQSDHREDAYHFGTRDRKVEFGIAGRAPLRSQTQFEENRWYHVAVTYDGTMQRVFVNGREEGSQTDTAGTPPSVGPLILGNNRANADWFSGKMQHIRISNVARDAFPYASFADILTEPSLAAGDAIEQPQPGTPDLTVESLSTYNVTDGTLVQAIVTNQGDGPTQNGFWIDLYANHQPTGPGDLTGSIRYWVASPIEAGATITLTTVLTEGTVSGSGFAIQTAGPQETTQTLYAQADSTGVLSESDEGNNISSGVETCFASADSYEPDDTASTARLISVGTTEVHNFDAAGDQDWFKFDARAGVAYTLQTSNLNASADTYLYLYDTDGANLLAANDDYGGTLASRITWQAPADGTYYVMAKHWNPNVGGCGTSYDLSVTLLGDFEPNCIVDVADIMQVASRWRSRIGDTNYDPTYDLDGDGDIDIVDIMKVAAHWGNTCAP